MMATNKEELNEFLMPNLCFHKVIAVRNRNVKSNCFANGNNLICFSKQLIFQGKTTYFPERNNLIWKAAKIPC